MKEEKNPLVIDSMNHEICDVLRNIGYVIEEDSGYHSLRFVRYKNSKNEIEIHTVEISFSWDGKAPSICAKRDYFRKGGFQEVRDFGFPASDLDEICAYVKRHLGEYRVFKPLI